MLRGFRWQFMALVIAIALFILSLTVRPTPTTPATSEPTPNPTATQANTTDSASVTDSAIVGEQSSSAGIIIYREGLVGSISRLNPLFADLNPVDRDITALIFEGLTRINRYGEPEGALAQRWLISSDGLEYVFFLRDDVLWQDGTPFSAVDVSFTMRLLRSPRFPGSDVLGSFWRTVETEEIDPLTVRFRLTQPLGSFLDTLTIGILPEHALRGISADQLATHPFNLTPIGTGPYQLEALRTNSSGAVEQVDLRSAPVYTRRLNNPNAFALERLSFRLYPTFDAALGGMQSAEIDGLAARNRTERAQLLTLNAVLHSSYEPAIGMLIFNWASESVPYFSEERVRRALDIGLQTSAAVERYLPNLAVPANSPLLPGSWAYSADLSPFAYNVAEAQALLTTAGIEGESNDVLFGFSILVPDDPALVSIAQDIATQWSQLNIAITVNVVDLQLYQVRLEQGDFEAAMVEFSLQGGADPDVYALWHQGQYPDGQNFGSVNDTRISELLERARRDPNGINRVQLYRQFQTEFIARSIALPLYYPLYGYAIDDRFTNIQLGFIGTSADRFKTIADWQVATP